MHPVAERWKWIHRRNRAWVDFNYDSNFPPLYFISSFLKISPLYYILLKNQSSNILEKQQTFYFLVLKEVQFQASSKEEFQKYRQKRYSSLLEEQTLRAWSTDQRRKRRWQVYNGITDTDHQHRCAFDRTRPRNRSGRDRSGRQASCITVPQFFRFVFYGCDSPPLLRDSTGGPELRQNRRVEPIYRDCNLVSRYVFMNHRLVNDNLNEDSGQTGQVDNNNNSTIILMVF